MHNKNKKLFYEFAKILGVGVGVLYLKHILLQILQFDLCFFE
ncbi:hypothetical protein C8N46_103222 [Kordia periserrulae]|uniref:Uncharacterized protein n=1 Tax=Kordia periserrulae TaxID=701523 RepID=A0A2T6C1C0_9FLAO|nr:hypothetical protein C8N46_103222 [Kordia periserrulae]